MGAARERLVTASVEDGVAVLTLDDPGHRNALSHSMSVALAAAVDTALDAGARAIVLAATPPVFCAGGSLDDLIAPNVPLREMYTGFLRLADAPVPTIAAVGAPAIGAGVNLPLACDVVVTSPSAVFDPRFLDVGIHPGGGHLWRLGQRVGSQGAAAMVLFGDRLDGREAQARGLAWRCVPDEELLGTAVGLARNAARRDPELVQRTKSSLRASAAVVDAPDAIEIEFAAQEWSMSRPGFAERVTGLRERIRTGKTVNRG
jgi:enoyl-CoA hydratase